MPRLTLYRRRVTIIKKQVSAPAHLDMFYEKTFPSFSNNKTRKVGYPKFLRSDNAGVSDPREFLEAAIQKLSFADVLQNGVLKNFAILTGKHMCWSLFLIKLQA